MSLIIIISDYSHHKKNDLGALNYSSRAWYHRTSWGPNIQELGKFLTRMLTPLNCALSHTSRLCNGLGARDIQRMKMHKALALQSLHGHSAFGMIPSGEHDAETMLGELASCGKFYARVGSCYHSHSLFGPPSVNKPRKLARKPFQLMIIML